MKVEPINACGFNKREKRTYIKHMHRYFKSRLLITTWYSSMHIKMSRLSGHIYTSKHIKTSKSGF